MYFKNLYSRPRPSQLCPALLPPIEIPGHASFPSGHSTQAHLMALCMNDVFNGLPPQATMIDDLWTLADCIARNREIAGLHYPSDTDAGVALHLLGAFVAEQRRTDALPASGYGRQWGMAVNGANSEAPRPENVPPVVIDELERRFHGFAIPSGSIDASTSEPGATAEIWVATPAGPDRQPFLRRILGPRVWRSHSD